MKLSTQLALIAEFEAVVIPLETVAEKYFNQSKRNAYANANRQAYPFKVFRLGDQKSPWLVHVSDLADYIDKTREKSAQEH